MADLDHDTQLNDAEVQVLASLALVQAEAKPKDKVTLEESGQRYSNFLQDWSQAYSSLIRNGLIPDTLVVSGLVYDVAGTVEEIVVPAPLRIT